MDSVENANSSIRRSVPTSPLNAAKGTKDFNKTVTGGFKLKPTTKKFDPRATTTESTKFSNTLRMGTG